jgi:hypothetical protein
METVGNTTNSGVLRWPKSFGITHVPAVELAASTLQIQVLIEEIQSATLRAKQLIAGRAEAELTTSPGANSWSVAQCLDHLAKTTNAFLRPISEAVSRAPRLAKNRRLQIGPITRMLIQALEPPYKLHFKVLAPIAPSHHRIEPAWSAFAESQDLLTKTAQSTIGLAIDRMRIESPVYARLNYNVYGALRMLAAHQRRHLWQMEQILNALDRTHIPSIS